MDKPTEHQCIDKKKARQHAINTAKHKLTEGNYDTPEIFAICDNCRDKIIQTLKTLSPQEVKSKKLKVYRNFIESIRLAIEEIEENATRYNQGKRAIQDEGLDILDDREAFDERKYRAMDSADSIYLAERVRSVSDEKRDFINRETAIRDYLFAIDSPGAAIVIGDEEHMKKYGYKDGVCEKCTRFLSRETGRVIVWIHLKMFRLFNSIDRLLD